MMKRTNPRQRSPMSRSSHRGLALALAAMALPFGAAAVAGEGTAAEAADTRPTVQLYALPDHDGTGSGFGAIVHNPAFLGIWITTGAKDVQEALHESVSECRAMVGEGCEPIGALSAPVLAIGYAPEGSLFFSVGATVDEALANLADNCRKGSGQPCSGTSTIALAERRVYTPVDYRRRGYAALAGGWAQLVDGEAQDADERVWVATGQASWADALIKTMEPCIAALGQDACRNYTASGDIRIGIYVSTTGSSGGFVVNRTEQAVIGDAIARCHADGIKCELIDFLNPQVEKVMVYDLASLRGSPLPEPQP